MRDYSAFDILGPIMIGPSSSHTAGAVRLGKIAKEMARIDFQEVEFILHGSFAMTYKGHGTDKALVAGILGMNSDDERIKNSFHIAKDKNINIIFTTDDLGYVHPNTVKIIFRYKDNKQFYVIGSSIGGGNIIITNINGNDVEFTGDKPTILLKYIDKKGAISEIASIITNKGLNIESMKVSTSRNIVKMICEVDNRLDNSVIDKISNIEYLTYVKIINPIER